MLYHLYDLHHAMLTPLRLTAETLQQVFTHPLVPASYTRLGRVVAAGSELVERATRRYGKPDFGISVTTIDGEPVEVSVVAVARKAFCDLLHFQRTTTRDDPKVLVVAPMSGHYATLLRDLAATRSIDWFERSLLSTVPVAYPGFTRRVYPGFIQLGGFMNMNLDRHFGSALKHFQHLVRGDGERAETHRRFYDEYLAVMDLPAEFFLQTVKVAFQDHALPLGVMTSRGRAVDTSAIRTTALMTVEGELDDISGPGQTFAAHALCANLPADRHRHLLQREVGHFGIFNGRRWRGEILPQVRDFIRENR
ncbi:MAG: polyhydroxyalkanoate depolymerase [Rhodospirillales bacterium]|nr:polyhydroxyalkanoate depolymerase [Rhodospirillales bacterium]